MVLKTIDLTQFYCSATALLLVKENPVLQSLFIVVSLANLNVVLSFQLRMMLHLQFHSFSSTSFSFYSFCSLHLIQLVNQTNLK